MIEIPEAKRKVLAEKFKLMVKPVKIIYFTQEIECAHCRQTREILDLVQSFSDKVTVEVHEFGKEMDLAKKFRVDKIPAIVLAADSFNAIRYFGAPSGYEFITFVNTIIYLSKGKTDLSSETKKRLTAISSSTVIEVLTLLTCPYCPMMVNLANQMAIENRNIQSEMIDIAEFPNLAVKYAVSQVPKVLINKDTQFVGAVEEGDFLNYVIVGSKKSLSYFT